MNDKPVLNVKPRDRAEKKANSLRRNGLLPVVLYGKDVKNASIAVNEKDFNRLFKVAGGNTIVLIKEEGKEDRNILIQDVERHPVTGRILHADFYQVKMTEKITAEVPLHFVGDSKAVREMDGSLITNRSEVEVECLPGDLPHEIEVSIEPLDDFEKSIHIKDLVVPSGVTILDDPEETVAAVEPPRSEEELAELEEVVEEVIPEEEEKVTEEEGQAVQTEEEKEGAEKKEGE